MSQQTGTAKWTERGPLAYTWIMDSMRIGYARCSTDKQDTELQRKALADLGIVDPVRYETDFDQLGGSRDPRQATRIWDVLILESWLRSHG